MAAMSAAPTATATLTPPSSSHGTQNAWNYSSSGQTEIPIHNQKSPTNNEFSSRPPLSHGNSANSAYDYGFEPLPPSRKTASNENLSMSRFPKTWEPSYVPPSSSNELSTKPVAPAADDVFGTKRPAAAMERRATTESSAAGKPEEEASYWIHRDKLARIENEELQAAGIILPRVRASSKPPRRDHRSTEKLNGIKKTTSASLDDPEQPAATPRQNSFGSDQKVGDATVPSWDLRLPEEVAVEGPDPYWTYNGGVKGGSKIPVAKLSPLPIPVDFLERPSPTPRKQSGPTDLSDTIAYPKTRSRSGSLNALNNGGIGTLQPAKRSATEVSPKKGTAAAPRKTSAPARGSGTINGRPKTRGGPNKDSTSSGGTTRPSTRSGELSPGNKQPEGEPPWMISSYKPDPRLPPEQQLLPTVARRLQQEKWEREGKFGNIYDKEFRPLTDEGFLKPPEAGRSEAQTDEEKQADEWPLRAEPPKSPALKQGTSYSTIPKISEKPPLSPMASPRSPMTQPQQPAVDQTVVRVPEVPEEQEQKKGGCGCCIVM